MLGHVDQRHRKVARRAQDRKPERTDQHDVAGGRRALLPERDDPRQQRDRQYDCHDGVKQPQLLEIAQAASTGVEFPLDGGVEAVVFVAEAAECADQRQVADDVDHLAVHRSRLVGEVVMQRLARRSEAEHRHQHDTRDDDQPRGHRQADGSDQQNCRNGRDARRQHVPDEHVFDGEHRVGCRGDPAGQHARQPIGEIAGGVAGQMAEHVAAEIAGDADEGEARRPACDPPQADYLPRSAA